MNLAKLRWVICRIKDPGPHVKLWHTAALRSKVWREHICPHLFLVALVYGAARGGSIVGEYKGCVDLIKKKVIEQTDVDSDDIFPKLKATMARSKWKPSKFTELKDLTDIQSEFIGFIAQNLAIFVKVANSYLTFGENGWILTSRDSVACLYYSESNRPTPGFFDETIILDSGMILLGHFFLSNQPNNNYALFDSDVVNYFRKTLPNLKYIGMSNSSTNSPLYCNISNRFYTPHGLLHLPTSFRSSDGNLDISFDFSDEGKTYWASAVVNFNRQTEESFALTRQSASVASIDKKTGVVMIHQSSEEETLGLIICLNAFLRRFDIIWLNKVKLERKYFEFSRMYVEALDWVEAYVQSLVQK